MSAQAISAADFIKLRDTANKPIFVYFWATWCAPCRSLAPLVDELATTLADQVHVVKLDVDQATELAADLNLTSIPCCILFKNGSEVDRIIGLKPAAELLAFCQKHL